MPTGTRSSTPIARNYLHDELLNSITAAPNAREVFFRMKLLCDNAGRLPGDSAVLGSLLFPTWPVKAATMAAFLRDLVRCNLIFHYKRGPASFVEIADHGASQRLAGNMTAASDFPAPPRELIEKWEARTGRQWQEIRKYGSNNVRTASEHNSNEVGTGSNDVRLKRSRRGQGQGSEGERGEFDGAQTAPARISVTFKELTVDNDAEQRIFKFTAGAFDSAIGFKGGYKHEAEFREIIERVQIEHGEVEATRANAIDFMSHVVNTATMAGFDAPAGWIRGLNELRRAAKL